MLYSKNLFALHKRSMHLLCISDNWCILNNAYTFESAQTLPVRLSFRPAPSFRSEYMHLLKKLIMHNYAQFYVIRH